MDIRGRQSKEERIILLQSAFETKCLCKIKIASCVNNYIHERCRVLNFKYIPNSNTYRTVIESYGVRTVRYNYDIYSIYNVEILEDNKLNTIENLRDKYPEIDFDSIFEEMKDIERRSDDGEFDISSEEDSIIEGIKAMPMTTLGEIQACKEASRVLSYSAEKVLLFKYILTHEDQIKRRNVDEC